MNNTYTITGAAAAALIVSCPCFAKASQQALTAAQQLNQYMIQSADIYLFAVQTQNAPIATQQFRQLYHDFINWRNCVVQNIDKEDFKQALNEAGTSGLQEYTKKMQQAAQHGIGLRGRNYIIENREFMLTKQAFDSAFHQFVQWL